MEYKFVTNENHFNNNDFKSDLNLIENSETFIWELHKSGKIIDLFDEIKKRNQKIQELFLIYKNSTKRFDKIQEEIVAKYPEIESVNFKSHFEKIIILITNLQKLVEKQAKELNISDNLLNLTNRTKVLNGDKKFDYESEFTTTVKEIINLINNIQNTDIFNTNSDEILKEKTLEQEIITEEIEEKEDKETSIKSTISILIDTEGYINLSPLIIETRDKNKQDILEEDVILNNAIEEINNKKTELLEEPIKEQILEEEEKLEIIENKEEQKYFTPEFMPAQNEELEKINEPTSEELMDIIESYFCYNDSPEIETEEKANILKNAMKSKSALKYAKIIWELENENKLEELMNIVNNIYSNTLSDLYNYDIGISKYSSSKSWAIWDIVKQIYYSKYPSMTDKTKYKIANPLNDEDKQNEILDRRIGWEIYSKMTTGEIDKFLIKFKEPIYRKRMVEFMIEKPNKYNTLSSYKLAELGKNVRVGFACMKK